MALGFCAGVNAGLGMRRGDTGRRPRVTLQEEDEGTQNLATAPKNSPFSVKLPVSLLTRYITSIDR